MRKSKSNFWTGVGENRKSLRSKLNSVSTEGEKKTEQELLEERKK
jgi:hypothetical protein